MAKFYSRRAGTGTSTSSAGTSSGGGSPRSQAAAATTTTAVRPTSRRSSKDAKNAHRAAAEAISDQDKKRNNAVDDTGAAGAATEIATSEADGTKHPAAAVDAVRGDGNGQATSSRAASEGEGEGSPGCTICMADAVEPVMTPCGHTFCSACITYWLNQRESGTTKRCPTCRTGLRQFSRQLSFTDELPAAWREENDMEEEDDDDEEEEDLRRQPLPMLDVGQRVTANFGEYGTWYAGTIATVNGDGTYEIDYDDGDFEADVKRRSIKTNR